MSGDWVGGLGSVSDWGVIVGVLGLGGRICDFDAQCFA